MNDARTEQAIKRIESALARVDAASRRMVNLNARHERLKTSVAQSLADIDRLIESTPE